MKLLKQRIKNSGLKQKFIAEKVGVGDTHLTMMLNGNAIMSNEVHKKIVDLLAKVHV